MTFSYCSSVISHSGSSDYVPPIASSRRLSSCENWRSIQWEISCDPKVGLGTLFNSVVIMGYSVSFGGPAKELNCPPYFYRYSRNDLGFSLSLYWFLGQNFAVGSSLYGLEQITFLPCWVSFIYVPLHIRDKRLMKFLPIKHLEFLNSGLYKYLMSVN